MPRENSSDICIEPGCNQPKYVNPKGTKLPRCHEHMKEFWRQAQQAKAAAEKQSEGEGITSLRTRTSVDRTFAELERRAAPLRTTPTLAKIEAAAGTAPRPAERGPQPINQSVQAHQPDSPASPPRPEGEGPGGEGHENCACTGCTYREVIDLLAQRNPRIAELVEHMRQARRLRDDLGI